jgi:hypothetical protein
MRSLPILSLPAAARQLNIPFDSERLREISPTDRRLVLIRLTRLLLEAAGVAGGGHDDDER